jgi:exonuclease SbcC
VNTDEIKVITRIQEVQKNDYSNYFEVLKKLSIEFLEQNLLPQDSLPSYEKLEKASDNIRLKLAQSAQEIVVKPEATLPEHVRLYTTLFSSKAELLDTAKKDLPQKREYIAQQFSTVYLGAKRVLEQKQVQIQLLLEKVGTLKEKYNLAIRDFQQNLTKSLQLPFYVYSAKILQNTPQCQGVFMVTQSDSGTIVFTPERGATHDILGQLSSGQLVVVSMAFYLAMNTVFSDHRTGLMAIDDPVQDLDALNIHSLTELMRREFIGQYQVIMSTHNDQDVNYMRYKFSTAVGSENIRNINVQQLFFEANENPSI